MTNDELLELAEKVYGTKDFHESALFHLEAFAKLVEAKASAKEREACAKVCEDSYTGEEACGDWPTPDMCAAAIRARGEA